MAAAKVRHQFLVFLIATVPALAAAAPPLVHPAPEMVRLIQMMKGTWATTLKFEPGHTYPKGAAGRGKQIWRSGPGGLSLIEYETASTPNGSWDGMSVTWWDPQARGFRAIWCDNHQASGCLMMNKAAPTGRTQDCTRPTVRTSNRHLQCGSHPHRTLAL